MSVLIKGMAMPTDIVTTLNIFADDRHVSILEKEPIILHDAVVELLDHGDLVDRDEFIGKLQSWALLIAMGHGDDDEWVKCIGEVCDRLYDAPVIIPAERSKK